MLFEVCALIGQAFLGCQHLAHQAGKAYVGFAQPGDLVGTGSLFQQLEHDATKRAQVEHFLIDAQIVLLHQVTHCLAGLAAGIEAVDAGGHRLVRLSNLRGKLEGRLCSGIRGRAGGRSGEGGQPAKAVFQAFWLIAHIHEGVHFSDAGAAIQPKAQGGVAQDAQVELVSRETGDATVMLQDIQQPGAGDGAGGNPMLWLVAGLVGMRAGERGEDVITGLDGRQAPTGEQVFVDGVPDRGGERSGAGSGTPADAGNLSIDLELAPLQMEQGVQAHAEVQAGEEEGKIAQTERRAILGDGG